MLTHTRPIAALREAGIEYRRVNKWTLEWRQSGSRRWKRIEPCKVLYLRNVKPCAFYSFADLQSIFA